MKNKLCLAGLAVAALVSSCSDDLVTQGVSLTKNTIGASAASDGTRATFDDEGQLYWSKGDKLAIWLQNNNSDVTQPLEGVLTKGENTTDGEFTVVSESDDYSYAVYPYNKDHAISNSQLTYVFPKNYNYTKVDQVFYTDAHDGNSYNPAMAGPITKDDGNSTATIYHLGGVLCVKFEKMPCEYGWLEVSSGSYMAGKFTASLTETSTANNTTTDGESEYRPELKTSTAGSGESNGQSQQVSFVFSGAVKGQPGVFYVPVPTGTYSDVKIKLGQNANTYVSTTAGTYILNRGNLYPLTLTESTITAGAGTEVEASNAGETLKTKDNVTITDVVGSGDGGTTITLPTSSEASSSSTSKIITLEKVAPSGSVTVTDGNQSGTTTAVKDLTVSLPNPASDNDAANLTINTPNSTVTLKGNAGFTTIKTVTASTADNTLIVTEGVTIDKLEIAKGNVRINKGATVKEITLATGNSAADVYYEKGAAVTAPSDDTKISMYEIEVGVNPITNVTQFAAAVAKGGEYTLLKDLALSATYYVASTLTLDLNQKTLTANNDIYSQNNGNLTFCNGKIVQANDKSLNVNTDGSLTLEKVDYEGKGGYSCIFVVQNSTNTSVTVKNSKVTITDGYYAVTTNGSTTPQVASNCTINLENSEFSSGHMSYGGTALLVNINANVTLKNCKFKSYCQAALLRGGTYEIDGCEFELDAKVAHDSGDTWMTKWGSGNACPYAALTIGNYLNTAYQYPTKVTFINKNTVSVTGTNANSFPAMHVCANAATDKGVTITGMSNVTLTQTKTTPDSGPEYGTDNITVDGETIKANVTATTTKSE